MLSKVVLASHLSYPIGKVEALTEKICFLSWVFKAFQIIWADTIRLIAYEFLVTGSKLSSEYVYFCFLICKGLLEDSLNFNNEEKLKNHLVRLFQNKCPV